MWMNVDLMEWLKTIGKCLRFQDIMVWVSFSYLLEKGHFSERRLIYKYAIKDLPLTSFKLHTEVILKLLTIIHDVSRRNGTTGLMNSKA